MMKNMITTAELADRAGIIQRTVQKRIKRLKIAPQRIGPSFLLTIQQAEKVLQANDKAGRPRKKPSNGK